MARSDDYISGIATPLVDEKYKGDILKSDIHIKKHVIIGSNSVVLPGVVANQGSSLGALSLVNKDLEPWYLYAGVPSKKIKRRSRERNFIYGKSFLSNN